ncbi:fructosyl amine:oxygen oxidoreductase [Penicillium macrosclerotiorum]|uniref:fructosyl amine:oxygen oxidoreductase n=1 Tax=Penicillium macrosclerotiorum TaxID=303699 RepID=UPI0025471037|nr:fructosyl amine:oxygen oxidoreductase [Penicillium macrosclerotiorum]KAJ5692426.1 fructosyl amine:oxygen oxidoreductase [Penicillium macrosclerotiorum]
MAPPPLSLESSILIIGGGTWGCSTAIHLVRRGYRKVTVLDLYEIPSVIAAGNGINEIMEHKELKEGMCRLCLFYPCSIMVGKNDPVFSPFFHETGLIVSASTPALTRHIQEEKIALYEGEFVALETAEDFRRTMPPGVLTGDFVSWKGWFHAQKAIISAYAEAKRLGVAFITGTSHSKVVALAHENGDVVGASTVDGILHRADRTILAAGAESDRLLDFKKQLRPAAWTLSHIPMTPKEAKLYKNLPVLFNIAKGFFIEPDEDKHELKICDEHPGYCNFALDSLHTGERRSIPFAKHQIPLEAESHARNFLRETMPHLADRPFSFARICWDADTVDRAFLIDQHPDHPSLIVAVGGSGNGAMQIPSTGAFISDTLEGKLPEELSRVVRWRPEAAKNRDWKSTQDRFGGPDKVMDLQDVKADEWTQIKENRSYTVDISGTIQYS